MATFSQMHNDYLDPDKHLDCNNTSPMLEAIADWLEIDSENEDFIIKRTKDVFFEFTTCGVSVDFSSPLQFNVAGYCEGIDSDLPSHILDWPFTKEKFWEAVGQADNDGLELWYQTHGCETCREHWKENGIDWETIDRLNLEYTDFIDLDEDHVPVWRECPSCGGEGDII